MRDSNPNMKIIVSASIVNVLYLSSIYAGDIRTNILQVAKIIPATVATIKPASKLWIRQYRLGHIREYYPVAHLGCRLEHGYEFC